MDIAILGAGVAGTSAALALWQQGHRVRVYERRSAPVTMGAGLVLWPNASFVLSALDVLSDIAAVSGRPQKMLRLDQVGNPLGQIDIRLLEQLMGYPTYSILRRDLQSVLLKQLFLCGIEVVYGCSARAIKPGPNGKSTVCFDIGPSICPDLIIGADGRKNSVARQYVAGDSLPVYQGFVNWIGVADAPSSIVDEVSISDYWGSGERFGLVAVNPRKVYWAAAQADANEYDTAEAAPKQLAQDLFCSWPAPIGNIICHTDASAIRKIRVYDLDPLSIWRRDNVLLIGDAAHAPLPTSGQGACQALEDAWQLASCLAKHDADLSTALATFTQVRSTKTAMITEQARVFARALFSTDPEACRIRNERAKAADPNMSVRAMADSWGATLPLTSSKST